MEGWKDRKMKGWKAERLKGWKDGTHGDKFRELKENEIFLRAKPHVIAIEMDGIDGKVVEGDGFDELACVCTPNLDRLVDRRAAADHRL